MRIILYNIEGKIKTAAPLSIDRYKLTHIEKRRKTKTFHLKKK